MILYRFLQSITAREEEQKEKIDEEQDIKRVSEENVKKKEKPREVVFVGVHGESLKVRLTAPPVEGEANRGCVKLLARILGVARSDVEIIQGHKSRHKTVLIRNLSPEALDVLLTGKGPLP